MNFYLHPYGPNKEGFYFDSPDEMTKKMLEYGIDEAEVQCIGFRYPELFRLCRIGPANPEEFLALADGPDGNDVTVAEYLADMQGCTIPEIRGRIHDIRVFAGSAEEPDGLRPYIDAGRLAGDPVICGDIDVYKGLVICNP